MKTRKSKLLTKKQLIDLAKKIDEIEEKRSKASYAEYLNQLCKNEPIEYFPTKNK
jgi:hypothetical protein